MFKHFVIWTYSSSSQVFFSLQYKKLLPFVWFFCFLIHKINEVIDRLQFQCFFQKFKNLKSTLKYALETPQSKVLNWPHFAVDIIGFIKPKANGPKLTYYKIGFNPIIDGFSLFCILFETWNWKVFNFTRKF